MPGEHRAVTLLVVLLCLAAPAAMAGETASAGTNARDQSAIPNFISARKEIPAELLDQKKEGTYWIGFPIIGYDPDTLFNIGATVNLFNDGPKSSPFFRYNSYERKGRQFRSGSQRRRQAFLYGSRISLLSRLNTAKLVLRARAHDRCLL